MLRVQVFAWLASLALGGSGLLVAAGSLAGCQRDSAPPPVHPQDEPPPLPPSSGTPIGYLLDNASQLTLRDDQLDKLKEIDNRLAIRSEALDTQLRQIEKPGAAADEKAQAKAAADAGKLQQVRRDNSAEALREAFAVLDPAQQTTARKLLEDRGITAPGSQVKPRERSPEDGEPLE